MFPKRATSTYTADHVERRLAELRSRPAQDAETQREIEYLEQLKAREFSAAEEGR